VAPEAEKWPVVQGRKPVPEPAVLRTLAGHRYAVLDTGRELSAFRTDALAHAPGLEIRATSLSVRDGRGRQVLGWRLEDERQRQRERGRER